MKRNILILIAAILLLAGTAISAEARRFKVYGPQGGLSVKVELPKGFNPETDKCPMVILMHGIFSSKSYGPVPKIAKALAEQGIASIRFDFDGHGMSQGKMREMTIANELGDAKAIWDYVRSLGYVTSIGLVGHSQGGAVASMFAGDLAAAGAEQPKAVVLLAPGSVIKEATQSGHFFGNTFDPKDPPEFIRCFGIFKLGRPYLVSTQTLDIYGRAEKYSGPVCIIHGTNDSIVPMWCSQRYDERYSDSYLHVIEGETHYFNKKVPEVVSIVKQFFADKL